CSGARWAAVRPLADARRYSRRFAASVHHASRRQDTPDETLQPRRRHPLMLLLNPGPVTLTERVRRSLLQPDLCHREREFFDLQDEARERLLAAYALDPAEWSAVLMTASGTGAVESMLAALVPEAGRLLVVENGVYGERLAQICAQYRIAHARTAGSWLRAPDLDAIGSWLDAP